MCNVKSLFQFDAKLGDPVDHSCTRGYIDWMRIPTRHPSAEQCMEWGLLDVARPSERPYALTWYSSFKIWQDVFPRSRKISEVRNTWYELARFAAIIHEICSPHHVSRECLMAYVELMGDRGLTRAEQRFRLRRIGSIFSVLEVKRVLKSNPARGLHRYDMVNTSGTYGR